MIRSLFKWHGGTRLAMSCLLAVLAGCGSSDYNRLAASRLATVRGEARFRSLFGPTKLPGTPISIRVPTIFRNSYVENSAHKEDGATIRPERVQPPFLQLPGFKVCYEGHSFDPEVGKLPYYCYLAAVPAKPGDAETLAADLQAKLKEQFKDTPDEWSGVDAESPTGKAVQWKKIRVTGDQPFRFFSAGTVITKDRPGIFELWICDKSDYVVIVGWRAPASLEGPATPPPAPTPATLLAPPPLVDSKIDLSTMPALTAGTVTVEAAEPTEKG